jgi:hypothetical protein
MGKWRQLNFGAVPKAEVNETMINDSKHPLRESVGDAKDSFTPKCRLSPDERQMSPDPSMRQMPSKDTDLKRAWMMTIPSSFFGAAEEWGRLRDAHVRFEPDRIIVEAHDRCGKSKIIHCSDIPARLDTEASTYKVDPEGSSVQITLQTFKSPREVSVSDDKKNRASSSKTLKGASSRITKARRRKVPPKVAKF